MMREAVKNVKTKGYTSVGNNCQDYAENVRKEYRKIERKTGK